jgi:nanoRNase/pAp phosphatase (c-di-AMP/oligoRNAs hydrolase)
MRYVLVCPDEFLWKLTSGALLGQPALCVVESPRAQAAIAEGGGLVVAGSLEVEGTYRRAFRGGDEAVLVAVPRPRQTRVLGAIRAAAPAAPVVALADDHRPGSDERRGGDGVRGVVTVPMAALASQVLEPALERAVTRARVERLRRHFARAERVLILIQDDPDPDAIASALALRVLLGRNKTAAPIATFGTITRPENRAMTRILEIEVEPLKPHEVGDYDMVAMVDAQPSFFEESLGEVDLVIDHHPEETPVRAPLKDIRPAYGATSTILTEYLRAAETKLPQRLATALLYGIKADTQDLERGATRADVDAFAFLHPHVNHSALRRIERPELPNAVLDVLAQGIARRQVTDGVVFSHLGPIAYPELVAQFADLFLQVEGAEWSVVSGTVNGELHVSVRNVGYVRAAGDVMRQAFGDLGSAGGHRSMAKAVIRLRDWRARVGAVTTRALRRGVVSRFRRALRG